MSERQCYAAEGCRNIRARIIDIRRIDDILPQHGSNRGVSFKLDRRADAAGRNRPYKADPEIGYVGIVNGRNACCQAIDG